LTGGGRRRRGGAGEKKTIAPVKLLFLVAGEFSSSRFARISARFSRIVPSKLERRRRRRRRVEEGGRSFARNFAVLTCTR